MLKGIKNLNQQAFTIIEVMIVLAIAGMIILVVLLAVPAVQRNGRNTAIKNDASSIAGGVSEFASNNNGAIPNTSNSSCSTGSVSLNNSSTGAASKPKVQGSTAVTCVSSASAVTPAAGALTVDFGYTCPDTISGTSVTPTVSARSTAIIYAIETSSGTKPECLAS